MTCDEDQKRTQDKRQRQAQGKREEGRETMLRRRLRPSAARLHQWHPFFSTQLVTRCTLFFVSFHLLPSHSDFSFHDSQATISFSETRPEVSCQTDIMERTWHFLSILLTTSASRLRLRSLCPSCLLIFFPPVFLHSRRHSFHALAFA